MRRASVVVLVVFVLCSVAGAGMRVGGFLQEEGRVGFVENGDGELEIQMFESWLELRAMARGSGGISRLGVRMDAKCDAAGLCEPDLNTMLREAYVELVFRHLVFSLGRQMFNWGMADEFNPSDLLNPEDLSLFMTRMKTERKLGVEAARAELYFGNFRWEVVWIPLFRPPLLPPDGSVWQPADLAELNRMTDEYPELVAVEDEQLPEPVLDNSSVASRVRATVGPVDLGAFGFYGWDYIPIYEFRYDFSGDAPVITVTPAYQRLWAAGAEFAAAMGSYTVRAEGAYFGDRKYNVDSGLGSLDVSNPFMAFVEILNISREPSWVKSPSYSVAFGIDRTFGEDFYVNVQYYRQQILDYDDDIVFPQVVDGILARVHDMFLDQTLTVGVNAIVGFYEGDGMIEPFVEYDITDEIEVAAGCFILYGGEETTFGQFDDNDSVYIRMKYSF